MIQLSVNVNKIATLRNSRGGDIPDLISHVKLILEAGAHGITVHPRSDERHITHKDVRDIKKFLIEYNQTTHNKVEFNIEGELSDRFLDIVLENKPDQATLVPVSPGEITSDHGFNFITDKSFLLKYLPKIKNAGIRTSVFVETDLENLSKIKEIQTDRVEFYTGPFAVEYSKGNGISSFETYKKAALLVSEFGIEINAGHDLDHINMKVFRNLPGLKEVSIGHRLISHSLQIGLKSTIHEYLKTLAGENGTD